jgi:hypothetical protein
MGEHTVDQFDEKKAQAFMKALLEDLRALAFMLEKDTLRMASRGSALSKRCS